MNVQSACPVLAHASLRLAVIALLCSVAASCTNEETVQSREARTLSLDGSWSFLEDPANLGLDARWYDASADRSAWTTMAVPGAWDQRRDLASFDGIGWYALRFSAKGLQDATTALVVDAVDDNAEIWLNGELVGKHAGYGQRFFFDVTGKLKADDNVIVMRIEDLAGPGGLVGSISLMEFADEEELMRGEYVDTQPVRSADWVRDAVIYEVNLRSFSKEGTFAALERRLPELKDLGITVVWLMPIHPVGIEKRKGSLGSPYSVKDFRSVNPDFGTMEDFTSLVEAVHGHGMRIIIDLVANHTAWDNALISKHPEWYTKDGSGAIISPNADWHDVADLDYSQAGLRQWMKDMMLFWVKDVGIDGFRCDVAEMVPHDFWVDAIAALRAVKPVMMLAEGADPVLHCDAFDLTYAWNTYDILRPLFRGELKPADVSASLRAETWRYPKGALRLRFSSNHDKDMYDAPAAVWYGPEAARAAAVLTSLLPGIPLVYTGQEVGNTTRLDMFERLPIDRVKDVHGFGALYRTLHGLRRDYLCIRRGEMIALRLDDEAPVFAFARRLGSEVVVVVVNCSNIERRVSVLLPSAMDGELLLARGTATVRGAKADIQLPGYGYVVME